MSNLLKYARIFTLVWWLDKLFKENTLLLYTITLSPDYVLITFTAGQGFNFAEFSQKIQEILPEGSFTSNSKYLYHWDKK